MHYSLALNIVSSLYIFTEVHSQFSDICGGINGRKFYLEYGESGTLMADYTNNVARKDMSSHKCTIELITCPSCVIEIEFRYLNISRNCGMVSVFDTCGCDYVWIYEPPIEDASGEQFCGMFVRSNVSELSYVSRTRTIAIAFVYNSEYGHAFSVDYVTKSSSANFHLFNDNDSSENRITVSGHPRIGNMNNASQFISTPFFPYPYPTDLSVEYVINCVSPEACRISFLFTDFLIDESSMVEFFDWNGQRMQVITGNVFRPPVIISNGPSMVVRFYANSASDYGFKATYSFILGDLDEFAYKPNIGCGGHVNNLGGGITMMKMVYDGTELFDCVWIIKPPENFQHRKTHLYVKIATFLNFAGTTELIVRQGLTSNQSSVEILRYPNARHGSSKPIEHVVPISQGFYISLRGVFTPQSRLEIIYAAFNYKDCYSGSDFLCHNLRCISILLNCDGFDHCGDDSDESSCFQDPRDHREFSKIPNFLFPKMEVHTNITTATLVFLMCTFGLIVIIMAMALLLYRVTLRTHHHRNFQDHLDTIQAILEETMGDIEEEIIVPDEPPDYEPPPEYDELLRLKLKSIGNTNIGLERCSEWNPATCIEVSHEVVTEEQAGDQRPVTSCRTASAANIPNSPPPTYEISENFTLQNELFSYPHMRMDSRTLENTRPGTSAHPDEQSRREFSFTIEEKTTKLFENLPKYSTQILNDIKKGLRNCKSANFLSNARKFVSCSEEEFARYYSDSELVFNSNVTVENRHGIAIRFRYKKSYSSDDLSSL